MDFCCEVTWSENWEPFLNTKLPLNKDYIYFEERFIDINYKRNISNIHDVGWKTSPFTFAGVSMISYGCGVSHYPQFL